MNKGYVYLMPLLDMSACKIGHSIVPKARIRSLRKNYSFDFEKSYILECAIEDMKPLEKILHKNFYRYNIKNMPLFDGYTEFFEIECLEKTLQFITHIDFNIKIKKGLPKEYYDSCTLKLFENSKAGKEALEVFNFFNRFMRSNKNNILDIQKSNTSLPTYRIYIPKYSVSRYILKKINSFFEVESLRENVVINLPTDGSASYRKRMHPLILEIKHLEASFRREKRVF